MKSAATIIPRAYRDLRAVGDQLAFERAATAAVDAAPLLAVQPRITAPSDFLRTLMARTDPPTREPARVPMFLVRS